MLRRSLAALLLLIALFSCPALASDAPPEPPHAMLTFDDGPSGAVTEQLLALLKDEQVPAAFFLCGYQVRRHPELVRQIAEAGHCVGSHTDSHAYLIHCSPEEIRRELTRSVADLTEITGTQVRYFRPPGGLCNDAVRQALQEAGLQSVLWDVDPEDWRGGNAEQIAASVLRQAHGDCIILLHDLHPQTVQAAKIIIRTLRARGYVFVLPDGSS